jgi:hypothetical protein
MKTLLHYLLLAFFIVPLRAAPPSTHPDRLREQLKKDLSDTTRVTHLLELSRVYVSKVGQNKSDLDTALLLARQAVVLSQSLRFYPAWAGDTC